MTKTPSMTARVGVVGTHTAMPSAEERGRLKVSQRFPNPLTGLRERRGVADGGWDGKAWCGLYERTRMLHNT